MKYFVKIDEKFYEVEIVDLHARPVIALVEGDQVEVWPEEISIEHIEQSQEITSKNTSSTSKELPKAVKKPAVSVSKPMATSLGDKVVKAPIPGVIISVAVKVGDAVEYGQELLVLEAMKMRNTVRSNRSARVAVVHISTGQSVNHDDPLIEFEE